ncbi:MAG: hypothetical protein OEZ43_01225 [Gammaproteobacteria bacterium]|nr:hypothetical protein [Gammaproteobacteria bacterium]
MSGFINTGRLFKSMRMVVAFATVIASFHTGVAFAAEIPPGFHRMPDGRIMANNPATAIAPPGYFLRSNGVLVKLDDQPSQAPQLITPGEVPPGFHRIPDGRLMANNPATAIAPVGYHLMPDGTLMSNSGGGAAVHKHGAGMWMFDIKYERMHMSGMLDTTKPVSAAQVTDSNGIYNYMMAPTTMDMDMVMFMAMYGVSDDFMLMLMPHYMRNSMGMRSSDGTVSQMSTSGVADTIFSAMFRGPMKLTFTTGLSLPTGSIDEIGPMTHTATFTEAGVKYPYGMQLGSGTLDIKQGISYEDDWRMLAGV